MLVKTKHMGEVEIPDETMLRFESGLPGFEHLRGFVHLTAPDDDPDSYFSWLQSTEDENVAFVLVDMVRYNPDYNPLVAEAEIADLGAYNPEEFHVYNIAVIPEEAKDATVNLKAPVVINTAARLGKQAICTNEDYTVRHYLFK